MASPNALDELVAIVRAQEQITSILRDVNAIVDVVDELGGDEILAPELTAVTSSLREFTEAIQSLHAVTMARTDNLIGRERP